MSRFTEDEVKTIITNVMTLLNEDVFGTIYDFLQIHPEAILDEYDTDAVFKIELGKSDLTTWKQVFNFALLNVFYGIDALHSRIESRDKHLFDAGMISEQAMARTLYMIKELNDKLDAYGVEPS